MPELTVVSNPRKKRRSTKRKRRSPAKKAKARTSRPKTRVVYRTKRVKRRRRRNPSARGFKFLGVDLMETGGGAAVATVNRLLPGYLGPRFGVADEGIMSYVLQLATAFGTKYLLGDILKQKKIANKGFEYTVVNLFERIIEDQVLGASGLGQALGLQGVANYEPKYYDITPGSEGLLEYSGNRSAIVDAAVTPTTTSGRWQSRYAG